MSQSGYDMGTNTFSPEGRLFQVEYAHGAIKLGSTAIGIATKDGVVLVVEKKLNSPLIDASSVDKIFEIDEHIGCAASGLVSDAKTLVEHARAEAQNHWFTFNERVSVESCVLSIADMALDFSGMNETNRKRTMARPFGVGLLISGYDHYLGEHQLFSCDPAGTFIRLKAGAMGSNAEGATHSLQEQYKDDMTFEEAETMALVMLRQGMEDKMTPINVDVSSIVNGKHHSYSDGEKAKVFHFLPKQTLTGEADGPVMPQ